MQLDTAGPVVTEQDGDKGAAATWPSAWAGDSRGCSHQIVEQAYTDPFPPLQLPLEHWSLPD